jgi:hypothetical protein
MVIMQFSSSAIQPLAEGCAVQPLAEGCAVQPQK